MPDIPEEAQQKIQQLQLLEQALQQLLAQKQSFQLQLLEAESALKELQSAGESYKIVGNIMIAASKAELEKELKEKKETTELRISSLVKQEARTREKAAALQKEVIASINA